MSNTGSIVLLKQPLTFGNDSRTPRWDMDWTQTKSSTSNSSTIKFSLYKRGTDGFSANTHFATELYLTIRDQNGNVVKTVDIPRIKVTSSQASFKNVLYNSYSFTINHNADGSAYFQVTITGSIYYGTNKTSTSEKIDLETTYTQCTPPTTINFDKELYAPTDKVKITWSGAGTGGANEIKAYDVYLLSTSNASEQIEAVEGKYTQRQTISHDPSSSVQATTFNLSGGGRGNILKVAIITRGGGGTEFNSRLSQSTNTAKINRLPGRPTVLGSTLLPYTGAGSCSLQVTGGTDPDGGVATGYVVVKDGSVVQDYTHISSRCILTEEGTYYFYSHDGLERGEVAQQIVVARASQEPTTTPQVTYTSHFIDELPEDSFYVTAFTVNCIDSGGLPGGTRKLKIYTGSSIEELQEQIEAKDATYSLSTSSTVFSISDIREPLLQCEISLKEGLYYKIATQRDDGSEGEKLEKIHPNLFYIPPSEKLIQGVYNNLQLKDGGNLFDGELYFQVQKGSALFSKARLFLNQTNQVEVDLQTIEQETYDILLMVAPQLSKGGGLYKIQFYTRNGASMLCQYDISSWTKSGQIEQCECTFLLGEGVIGTIDALQLEVETDYRLRLTNWLNTPWNWGAIDSIETELEQYGFSSNSKVYLQTTSPAGHQVEIGTISEISTATYESIYIDCPWKKCREIFSVALQDKGLLGKEQDFCFQVAVEKFNGTKLFKTDECFQKISFKKPPEVISSFQGENYGIFAGFDGEGKLRYFKGKEEDKRASERIFIGDPIYLQALVQCYDQTYLSPTYAKLLIKEGDKVVEVIQCQATLANELPDFEYSSEGQTPFSVIITSIKDIVLNRQINTTLSFCLSFEGTDGEFSVKAKTQEENNNQVYYCGQNEASLHNVRVNYDNKQIAVSIDSCAFLYPYDPEVEETTNFQYIYPAILVEWRTDAQDYKLIDGNIATTSNANLPERVLRITRSNFDGSLLPEWENGFSHSEDKENLFTEETKKLWFRVHYIQQIYRDYNAKNNETDDFWQIDVYSEEFVIYDLMPTVGYRPNQLLVNRVSTDEYTANAALVVGPVNNKNAIYLLSNTDGSHIEINLEERKISGLTVDCGGW